MKSTLAPWLLTLALVPFGCGSEAAPSASSGGSAGSSGAGGGTSDGDAAELVSSDVPDALTCAEKRMVSVAMRNTGSSSWTAAAGYKLGAVDDSDPLYTIDVRVLLGPDDVIAPGETHTFAFELTGAAAPGPYTTDWRMVRENVHWFGEPAEHVVNVSCQAGKRTGIVTLSENSLADDQGPFNALGATLMWAAWGYEFDRARLEQNLDFLSKQGFDYIRALGVVGDPAGEDYWDGREIDDAWPSYDDVIAGLTDLAYDEYGLRIEWTLIGDGQVSVPSSAEKLALVDRFIAMSQGREHKIIHFEIANEFWQNGFPGQSGLDELRALSAYLSGKTQVLVAASAPATASCAELEQVYAGGIADIATVHFDRDIAQAEGSWRPVHQPWLYELCAAELPVASNNEPIGPGASVNSENDPVKLVSGAIMSFLSGLPLHVFHSNAGVRGDTNLFEMAGSSAFSAMTSVVPNDLASWTRKDATAPDAPFVIYAGSGGNLQADKTWLEVPSADSGVVRAHGAVKNQEFFVFPIGILSHVTMEPRQPVTFEVIDPMSGSVIASHTLAAGERFELAGHPALVLRGTQL